MSTDTELFKAVPGRYGVAVTRTGDMTVSCHLPLEPDKLASDGSARPAAVMMGVDMAAGLAAGMGVHPDATMTADTAVQFVSSARAGPLRIDARCIKPGRSQSLSEVTVVDEGADDAIVAVATANHGVMIPTSRPRPAGRPTFTNEIMALGIGAHLAQVRPYATEVVRDSWLAETHRLGASVETRLEWARSLIAGGRLDSAVKLLQQLARTHPDRAEVFRRLGEADARAGRSEEAVSAYVRAAELDPFDVDTHLALAEMLLQRHDIDSAERRPTGRW